MAPRRTLMDRAATRSSARVVLRFVLISYGLSWSLTLPLLLGGNGLGILPYVVPPGPAFGLIVLQSYGPFVAALYCAPAPLRLTLLRGLRTWGGGWATALLCVAGPPVALVVGALTVGGGTSLDALGGDPTLPLAFVLNLPVLLVLGGPLGEELGWRGFALSKLQLMMNPISASIVLGMVWGIWHAPNFFIPEMGTWQGSKVAYLGLAMILSLVHTGAFNAAASSVLAVTVLHASIDTSTRTIIRTAFGVDRAGGNAALFLGFALLLALIAWRGGLRSRDAAVAVSSEHGAPKLGAMPP